MLYLSQFFSVDYWFGFPGFITTPLLVILIVVFGGMLIAGLAAVMFYPKIEDRWKRQVVRRAGSGAAWIGFLGLLLTFMRYERIPVFMYRYWFLVIDVAFIVWAVRMRKYALERREKLEEETRTYQTKEKYLRQ